jgi:hypothetical protein
MLYRLVIAVPFPFYPATRLQTVPGHLGPVDTLKCVSLIHGVKIYRVI